MTTLCTYGAFMNMLRNKISWDGCTLKWANLVDNDFDQTKLTNFPDSYAILIGQGEDINHPVFDVYSYLNASPMVRFTTWEDEIHTPTIFKLSNIVHESEYIFEEIDVSAWDKLDVPFSKLLDRYKENLVYEDDKYYLRLKTFCEQFPIVLDRIILKYWQNCTNV